MSFYTEVAARDDMGLAEHPAEELIKPPPEVRAVFNPELPSETLGSRYMRAYHAYDLSGQYGGGLRSGRLPSKVTRVFAEGNLCAEIDQRKPL